jgi:nitrite reductase/ring-hydroxylating ferredoxin subunit/CDGSH-type Zn-finger protein
MLVAIPVTLPKRKEEEMAEREIVIVPHNNGPYEVRGRVKIVTEGGRVLQVDEPEAWLCRCGHSGNKPFCDGTHEKIGFKSDLDAATPVPSGGFEDVCGEDEVQEGALKGIRIGGQPVVLGRVGGRIHAMGGVCTHAQALLENGEIEVEKVHCPLHGAIFDITTGKVLSPPATAAEPTFDVRVETGRVLVSRTPR